MAKAQERKLTLAINVNYAEELPDTADYVAQFLARVDKTDEYDVDLHVAVNPQIEPEKEPIGFAVARGKEEVWDGESDE